MQGPFLGLRRAEQFLRTVMVGIHFGVYYTSTKRSSLECVKKPFKIFSLNIYISIAFILKNK